MLAYRQLLVSFIQKAGGMGYFTYAGGSSLPYKFLAFSEMDKEANSVFGEVITAFAVAIVNSSDVDVLLDMMEEAYRKRVPVVASHFADDHNYMDDAITGVFSLFRLSHYVLWPVTIYCLWYNIKVAIRYYNIKSKSPPLSYCTFSLMIALVANSMRVVRGLDVLGVQGHIPILYARPLFTCPTVAGFCSALSTYFFWDEASIKIQNSLNLKIVVLGKRRKVACIALSLVLLFVDLYVSISTTLGTIYGNVTLIPIIAGIVFEVCMATAILMGTRKMRLIISSLKSSIHPEPAPGVDITTEATHRIKTTLSTPIASPVKKAMSGGMIIVKNSKTIRSNDNNIESRTRTPDTKSLRHDLIKKLEGAEKWMTRCGVSILLLLLSTVILGTNVQYKGVNNLAVFMLAPLFDQVTAYMELRVIAISIEKAGL